MLDTDGRIALAAELSGDPLGRGYAGMTDAEAHTDLHTAYRDVPRQVSVDAVRQYLIAEIDGSGIDQRSTIALLREFAEKGTVRGEVPTVQPSTSLAARQSAAEMIWYMLQREDRDALFEVSNTNIAAQFVSIGPDSGNGPSVLTNTQLLAIANLAVQTVSRVVELDIAGTDEAEIRWARGG